MYHAGFDHVERAEALEIGGLKPVENVDGLFFADT